MEVAAHNEFSRVLAEHGMFGVTALLIMVIMPIKRFFANRKILERIIIIAFIGFCFVFMTHSATRIAAPCFLYGFAFMRFVPALAVRNRRLMHIALQQQLRRKQMNGNGKLQNTRIA